MTNSRKVSDLLPVVQAKAKAFVAKAKAAGIDVLITSTYRDRESQAALYAQGRTAPGRVVTNARPGQSYHQYRVAFDFVPIRNGKAIWNDMALFRRLGEMGELIGLEWGGRWKFKDLPHLQYTGGLSLKQLQAGQVPS